MGIAILDGMKQANEVGEIVKKILEEKKEAYHHFELSKMYIEPCRNCGGCRSKTRGKCIFDDDMEQILTKIVKDSRVVMLTPISFGGYNAQLKKAIDKFSLLGLPLFTVKKGKLAHPGAYEDAEILSGVVIGIAQGQSKEQKESFSRLVHENNEIMDAKLKMLILEANEYRESKEQQIRRILEEAGI